MQKVNPIGTGSEKQSKTPHPTLTLVCYLSNFSLWTHHGGVGFQRLSMHFEMNAYVFV